MSTIDVQNINSKTGNSAITISDAGTVSAGGNEVVTTQSAQLGRRNLIINGAMQVAQRGTNVTGKTTTAYYTVDRFEQAIGSLGTWTIDQSTDAPDGFSNSCKITCTTADSSPASNDYIYLRHFIEAQNLQHLSYGTSSAKTMTLSFWVKSNKTGDASFDMYQNDNSNKLFSNSYTINTADTWEYKTISIPADTSGVIDNDNGVGLQLDWWLNSGSTFSGGSFATTWQTYDATNRNVSNLGVGGATSDYFAITGVQLEVGDTATPFEHRSFGEEIALCRRYFIKYSAVTGETNYFSAGSFAWTGGISYIPFTFTTAMRSAPTLTTSGSNPLRTYGPGASYVQSSIGITGVGSSSDITTIELYTSGSSVTGFVRHEGQTWLAFDSEL